MIRAVLDTNVLLAGLRSRNGASFEILSQFRQGRFILLIANTVLTEYEEVLKREGPAFGLTPGQTERFLDALCAAAEEGKTSSFWKPCLPDPDVEPMAQLAIEAKVDCLVTHNLRDFPADRLPGLPIVSPSDFLHLLPLSKP